MRLINAEKFKNWQDGSEPDFFEECFNRPPPGYAILSHTWDEADQEVTYQDCHSKMNSSKTGHAKIFQTCERALEDDIEYVWVDTCCIDKRSSAELSEGINSMFKWYQNAKVCYAYLSDWAVDGNLKRCRWFTRGWTLQELIAPKTIKFFDENWGPGGTKSDLCHVLSRITSIDTAILTHETSLSSVSVAKRLSWASKRVTSRVEDIAYCLLGIFDIAMPMLYGEGTKAFYRLQEEILRSTCDLSLLAWTPTSINADYCGFFATSVTDFENCHNMDLVTDALLDDGDIHLTSKGLRIGVPEYLLETKSRTSTRTRAKPTKSSQYALKLNCMDPEFKEDGKGDFLTIPMRKIGPNIFVRARALAPPFKDNEPYEFRPVPVEFAQTEVRNMLFLTTLPRSIGTLRPGVDIGKSSRSTLVKIEFTRDIMKHAGISRAPNEVWDEEDGAFLGSRASLDNWAAIGFREFEIIFVCFWKKSGDEWDFRGTLLRLEEGDNYALWRDLLTSAKRQPILSNSKARLLQVALGDSIQCTEIGGLVDQKDGPEDKPNFMKDGPEDKPNFMVWDGKIREESWKKGKDGPDDKPNFMAWDGKIHEES
ncbi:unnamed protein product [Clonostachys byssicola]|uniref:Heterokaryon incompatibility domain-containing protein n=1 Tax=Clonostachys byssicola TaxID=160290 RepID=A0A9N9UIK3_9HYPO|nr:unnamed protein product [Clonostachys byssicola]